ncbi:MAG: hypothetical protein IKF39_02235 [Oscillospiraceae bacterium]|nr:hypothetical protein [Oscillospiraceae bacterium]
MKNLRQLSIRCSGLIEEAKLTKGWTTEELARAIGITRHQTLTDKSSRRQMYTLTLDKICVLADLAGYDIEFVRRAG